MQQRMQAVNDALLNNPKIIEVLGEINSHGGTVNFSSLVESILEGIIAQHPEIKNDELLLLGVDLVSSELVRIAAKHPAGKGCFGRLLHAFIGIIGHLIDSKDKEDSAKLRAPQN